MTTLGTPKGSHKLKKREKRPFQNQTKKTHEKNARNEKEIVWHALWHLTQCLCYQFTSGGALHTVRKVPQSRRPDL